MNELQNILEDSVARLFQERIDREFLIKTEETGWAPELWAMIADQGLTQVLVGEDAGGMGGSWLDAFVVVRACGRYAVPLPVPETLLCRWLMERAGVAAPAGTPGLLTRPLAAVDLVAGKLATSIARVPWGRRADYFVGLTETARGAELVVSSTANVRAVSEANLAREPRDSLHFDGTDLLCRAPVALPADAVKWLGALLRAAQIAGAAAGCLELSVDYTSQREQFGRRLSQFQAIQQQLAELAGAMSSVDTMAMAAFAALDARGIVGGGRNARFEIACAKCRASEAVETLTRISHQVHGAIGFTYEYGLHFLTRRLWSWRAEFGGSGEWAEYLGETALAEGGGRIWRYITS